MKPLSARPRCARCREPVQSFTEEELTSGDVVFVAKCHGETERVRIDSRHVSGINFGEAFVQPKLLT